MERSPAFSGNILPGNDDPWNSVQFTLDRSLAQQLNQGGEIPEPLWQRIQRKRHGPVPACHGFNHRAGQHLGDTGRRDSNGYSPCGKARPVWTFTRNTTRQSDPWYLNAVGRKGVVWTKYANWDLPRDRGKACVRNRKGFRGADSRQGLSRPGVGIRGASRLPSA